ncbi:DUF6355 family natural product biosynthesis protein [Allokutzneria sp. NRRL B-24872]|uniref:DUF6355 family natural product biosynthesis protein n=1 Tax=Allokutzneria sp. NRRL B-24872 TaxID=1137961 RepID=UPI0011782BBE|nr:DUF6355 family natural product biosynthesis protein [Allokutzneria sp. NRRL B-24872]
MRIARALGVLALSIVAAGVAAPIAQADPAPRGCGFQNWGKYEHCSNVNVMLQVERVFGSDFKVCVKPGRTNLQEYSPGWAVTDAWYIGGANCTPGYKGTVD